MKDPKPLLTMREQSLIAFVLALLLVGGIVREVRVRSASIPATAAPSTR